MKDEISIELIGKVDDLKEIYSQFIAINGLDIEELDIKRGIDYLTAITVVASSITIINGILSLTDRLKKNVKLRNKKGIEREISNIEKNELKRFLEE